MPRSSADPTVLLKIIDAFADKTSDRVRTLSATSLLSALDTKHTLKELRYYLAHASS